MKEIIGYTLVQHSGYAWGNDHTFIRGVEVVGITKASEKKLVESSGGIVFDKWIDADDFSMDVMYPENHYGIIPMANGGFGQMLSGLRIYVLSADDWSKTSKQISA